MLLIVNEDNFCIYFEFNEFKSSAVYLPEEIIYNLPFNRWKKYKFNNNRKLIEYSDSEGNVWDISHGNEMPFVKKELNMDTLDIAYQQYVNQKEALHNVKKLSNNWEGLSKGGAERFERAFTDIEGEINKNIMDVEYILRNNKEV